MGRTSEEEDGDGVDGVEAEELRVATVGPSAAVVVVAHGDDERVRSGGWLRRRRGAGFGRPRAAAASSAVIGASSGALPRSDRGKGERRGAGKWGIDPDPDRIGRGGVGASGEGLGFRVSWGGHV